MLMMRENQILSAKPDQRLVDYSLKVIEDERSGIIFDKKTLLHSVKQKTILFLKRASDKIKTDNFFSEVTKKHLCVFGQAFERF